jgi:peptide deformylase
MGMLDIITIGDEVLREKAEKIDSFGPEIRILADAMIESMRSERGIGLAGPQVGVLKKIFVVELPEEQEPRIFINPEIIETAQEQTYYEEGCLSIPGVYEDVLRPAWVRIQAQDINGKAFTFKAEGMLGRVVQHENDHLQGVLFVDRIPEEKREKLLNLYNKRAKIKVRGKSKSKNRRNL